MTMLTCFLKPNHSVPEAIAEVTERLRGRAAIRLALPKGVTEAFYSGDCRVVKFYDPRNEFYLTRVDVGCGDPGDEGL